MSTSINALLMELENAVGVPVAPDLYSGKAKKFIVFTFADERAAMYADDDEEYITTSIKLSLYTPSDYNYLSLKAQIKKALKTRGFCIENIESYLESELTGSKYTRHTVFNINYTTNNMEE